MLTKQQQEEVKFWRNWSREHASNYFEFRGQDFHYREKHLPGFKEEVSIGLDYGCGLVSPLEGSGLKFDAIDPLMDEYRKLMELPDNYYTDIDKKYDWIFCTNVIDHEEQPERIIEDFKTKLNKSGRIYFHVNFDDNLSPAHYSIFNEEIVNDLMKDFKQTHKELVRDDPNCLTHFYAIYVND